MSMDSIPRDNTQCVVMGCDGSEHYAEQRQTTPVLDHLERLISREVGGILIVAVDQGAPVESLEGGLHAEHGLLIQTGR